MTEVTRIACPGCRTLLRFEPEALDFPANCGACDCRFTAGLYVRVSCPNCRNESKIRESFRGRRIRCGRCRYDFLADKGIPQGAGGRLLVARMLDTGLPNPPETIQPFLGHARVDAGSSLPTPNDVRVEEAERLKAEAIAERDRLAQESRTFKAILARLVGTSTDKEELELARLVADRRDKEAAAPGLDEASVRELTERRNHLELLVGGLRAELELAREEFEELRQHLTREVAVAKEADERARAAEESLALAIQEHREAAQKMAGLMEGRGEAIEASDRDRSALPTSFDRLNQAVLSAKAGEDEALERLEDFACRLREAEAEVFSERRRTIELGKVVGELKQEIESIRKGEASKALEIEPELASERRKSQGLGELVEGLRAEIEVLREALAEKSLAHEAELAERSRGFEEARQGHVGDLARIGQERDAVTALAEQARAEADRSEAKYRVKVGKLTSTLAERDKALITALEENKTLVADLKRIRAEAEGPRAENERLAEAVDRLLDENQQLNESAKRLQTENRRMTAEVQAVRASRSDDQGPPVSADMEAIKAEAERREKALVTEIQWLRQEFEKLATSKDAGEIVQRTPSEKLTGIEPSRLAIPTQAPTLVVESSTSDSIISMGFPSASDVWDLPGSIDTGAIVSTEAESGGGHGKDVDLHGDLALTMLYGEKSDDGESAPPGGR